VFQEKTNAIQFKGKRFKVILVLMLPSNLLLVVTYLTVDHRNNFFCHWLSAVDDQLIKQNNNKKVQHIYSYWRAGNC